MLGFQKQREWVYPQSVKGAFMTLRRWTFLGLHLVLFVAPWIMVRGHPLLLIDLPHRRFYVAGTIFTAADTIFLVLLLMFAAFSLFFFTSLFGRVWCGYTCPQTVFLESWIRPLEKLIEGDRTVRKRRDGKAISWDLVWRKAVKWTAFLGVAFMLGMAMLSLFVPVRELWSGQASQTAYALVAAFTAAWYVDFTWFREQFCNYLCPYARFQSALTDDETWLISYDEPRGEPRGGGKAAADAGRCIACQKCVIVCPQGIDIRNGFQLECIQCARCIDACTSVMEPLGHETLIRYSTMARDEGRPTRRLRPRTLVYGALMTSLVAAVVVLMIGRIPFEASVNRTPGSLFQTDPGGWVRNTFLLKITNNDPDLNDIAYEVYLEGLDGAEVLTDKVVLGSTQTRTLPLVIRIPAEMATERTIPFTVHIRVAEQELILATTFKTGAENE